MFAGGTGEGCREGLTEDCDEPAVVANACKYSTETESQDEDRPELHSELRASQLASHG